MPSIHLVQYISSILVTENIRKLGYMQSRHIFIQRRKTVYNSKYVNNLQLKSFQTIVERLYN